MPELNLLFITGHAREDLPLLKDIRQRCIKQLEQMRPDHMRRLNPTPYKVLLRHLFHIIPAFFNYTIPVIAYINYKFHLNANAKQVSVSAKLYDFIHFLWLNEAPVGELQWDSLCFKIGLSRRWCIFSSNNTKLGDSIFRDGEHIHVQIYVITYS